jgi:hypothetical protein
MNLDIRHQDARVNITWRGQNGELPDNVRWDCTDGDVRGWVTEAVHGGNVPGIVADHRANFRDYVIDRFAPTEHRPYNLIQVRPPTPFG